MKKLYLYFLASLFVLTGMSAQVTCAQKTQASAASSVFSKITSFSKNIKNIVLEKLHLLSPVGHIERAEKVIRDIESDDLVSRDFKTDLDLVNSLFGRFGLNWPLAGARDALDRFAGSLKTMQDGLNVAKQKIACDPKYLGCATQCDTLLKKIIDLEVLVDRRKASIVACADFKRQETLKQKVARDRWIETIVRIGFGVGIVLVGYYYDYRDSWSSFADPAPQCLKILGVPSGASQKDLQQALRKMVKEWHPDICGSGKQKECEQRMSEINGCYELLTKKQKRY